jgi:RNA polymerase sigma-70 factor (ECF subfamily)
MFLKLYALSLCLNWYEPILTESVSREPATLGVDAVLFQRFLKGDDAALVELFDRHNHRLFLYCMQFVLNIERAEDITQEMWERVIGLRKDASTTAENPVGLFLTIARNLCVDAIRKERNHLPIHELAESDHPVSYPREMSHLEELVIKALPQLPPQQREVLVLNAYSGYRFDEIAEILGEPVGAIRTRAWRARTHLARIIAVLLGLDEDGREVPR